MLEAFLYSIGTNLLSSLVSENEEKAKKFIESKTGVKLNDISKLTPDELTRLSDFEEENKELIMQKFKEFLMDKQNARQMNIEIANSSTPVFKKVFPEILALMFVVLSFVIMFVVVFNKVDNINKDLLMLLVGSILNAVTMILSFYFGSSLGSKIKDERLKNG